MMPPWRTMGLLIGTVLLAMELPAGVVATRQSATCLTATGQSAKGSIPDSARASPVRTVPCRCQQQYSEGRRNRSPGHPPRRGPNLPLGPDHDSCLRADCWTTTTHTDGGAHMRALGPTRPVACETKHGPPRTPRRPGPSAEEEDFQLHAGLAFVLVLGRRAATFAFFTALAFVSASVPVRIALLVPGLAGSPAWTSTAVEDCSEPRRIRSRPVPRRLCPPAMLRRS